MDAAAVERALGPELSAALARKGYTQLTAVQQAVLDPALHGRDLRITSQTGSGKTLAIGFALRECAASAPAAPAAAGSVAPPGALVVAPTRELARQTQAELQWLYADYKAHVVAITGGSSYRDERRELARSPRVIVGTPGRLLDHLQRGGIDPSALAVVVLDEADRLLDMGFREDLDAILALVPAEHRTHLVSATFPRAVRALADGVQRAPAHVEGTRLGVANADIDHVIHVIEPREKTDALVNLLLAQPEAQTLVFARTRADVSALARELVAAGFAATALSGELDQAARNRALSAFKRGREDVLVATDVAARGLDVQDVTRVIHFEPPTSADAYTHRSGRTGRAGRKGTSSLLVSLSQVVPATRLLRSAGIPHRFEPIPTAESIRRARDEQVFAQLTSDEPDAADGDARALSLARRLLATGRSDGGERIVARLVQRVRTAGAPEPRDIREVALPTREPARQRSGARPPHDARSGRDQPGQGGDFVPFRVTWGGRHGADARRVLALVCRRGHIRGSDVGAIRIEADHSIVEVARAVAETFSTHAARPDSRDRRVRISPLAAQAGGAPPRRRRAPRR